MKGFAPVFAIAIVVVLLALGGGVYYGVTRQIAPPPPAPIPAPQEMPAPTPERPEACIQLYDPVCGVDNKTYSNDCFARMAGVAVLHPGECRAPEKPAPQPPPPSDLPAEGSPEAGAPNGAKEGPPAPAEELVSFSVEADDNGFYPASLPAVPQGTRVKITFLVRETNVYFGGLDFRSAKFSTPKVPPGGQTAVEFTAEENLLITSYWPASGVKKADFILEVK